MTETFSPLGTAIHHKRAERERLEREVDEFLANGGKIEQCKFGQSGDSDKKAKPAYQRRRPSV